MSKFSYDADDLGYDIISVLPSPLEGEGARRAGEGDPSQKQISYSCDPPTPIAGQPGGFRVDQDNNPSTPPVVGQYYDDGKIHWNDGNGNSGMVDPPSGYTPPHAAFNVHPAPNPPAPARATNVPAGVTPPSGFYVAQRTAGTSLPTGAREVPDHNDLMFYPLPHHSTGAGGARSAAVVPEARRYNLYDYYIDLITRPR